MDSHDKGAAMATGSRGIAGDLVQGVARLVSWVGRALGAFLFRRQARRALLRETRAARAADGIQDMNRHEFEQLVGEGFRLQGFDVREHGAGGGLVLGRGKDKYLVQCSQWKAAKVGVAVVRELYAAIGLHRAAGGFIVTSGRFTDEAKVFAETCSVRLVDGPKLRGLLRHATDSLSGAGASDIWLETRPEISGASSRY